MAIWVEFVPPCWSVTSKVTTWSPSVIDLMKALLVDSSSDSELIHRKSRSSPSSGS